MATRDCDTYSMTAISDLTGKEGCFGKQSTGGVVPCSALGERADCVIMSEAVIGKAVDVAPRSGRRIPIKVGAVAVAQDAELTTDANGLAKTAVSTNVVRMRALTAGAAGEIIAGLWIDAYIKP